MKRILLTTTSLVLAAGVAQADVSFSGTAGVALIDDNGASVYNAGTAGAAATATSSAVDYVAPVARSTRDGMFFESYYGSLGDEWDASVKYTAGALVASFALDEADATTIIADFALGGGASAFAAMHDKAGTDNDLTTVGLNFAF